MKIVVSHLSCQLGNQLFQIANGYNYAQRIGGDFYIEGIKLQHRYPCIISNFQFYENDLSKFHKFIENRRQDYKPEINDSSYDTVYFEGMYQSEDYFNPQIIKSLFKNILQLPDEKSDYVGIQVRRGDYLKCTGLFNIPPADWYNEMYWKYFNGKKAIITSNDEEWCRNNLRIENAEYISSSDPVEDIRKMSICKDFIISASTYGWWCAYLAEQPDSKIICPWPWFNPHSNIKDDRKYPERWIKEDV